MPATRPHRSRPNIPLLLSTDIAGIWGRNLQNFYQLYQTIEAEVCPLDGVEFMRFRFNHLALDKQLQKYQLPITGLHGNLGWNHPGKPLIAKIHSGIFSTVTPGFRQTFKTAHRLKPKYLLFHQPDFGMPSFRTKFNHFLESNPETIIMIENVFDENSLANSIVYAQQYKNSARMGVMIDLVHLLREVCDATKPFQDYRTLLNTTNFDRHWNKMLQEIREAFQQSPIIGFHIPLGNNLDSLPWDLIRNEHWQEFSKLMTKYEKQIKFLTLENQHPQAVLKLKNKDLAKIIADKKTKLSKLVQLGVI